MATITISDAVKTELANLRTASPDRNSYDEVVKFLLNHFNSHKAWSFTLEDIAAAMNSTKGTLLYKPEYDFTKDGRINAMDIGQAVRAGVPSATPPPPPPPLPPVPDPIPTPTPVPVPVPTTYPVRAALIIAKDAPAWAEQAAVHVENTIKANRSWLERETGYTYDYVFKTVRVEKTMQEFKMESGVYYPGDACSPNEGVRENALWPLFSDVLGWPSTLDAGPHRTYRHVAVYIPGGGWAGGRHNQAQIYDPTGGVTSVGEDYGECLYGSWDFEYFVTGQNSPCAGVYGNGRFPTLAAKKLSGSLSHEMMHMFGTDCHNPVIWLDNVDTPITAAQKQQFINNNRRFVRPLTT